MLVRQEFNYSFKNSKRIIWLSTCIGVFIIFFGVILKLLNTDLVAERESTTLDYLKDLLNNTIYMNHKLAILKEFYLYGYLKQAPTHDLHILSLRIHRGENRKTLVTAESMDKLMQIVAVFDKAMEGK